MSRWIVAIVWVACSAPAKPPPAAPAAGDRDPDGPHRAAFAAQVKPFLDGELVTGLVIGVTDAGIREIYGFGTGPGGKPPTGTTLFELGPITKVYTGLLLADAIQRREVELDTAVAELLPPGVTVPTHDRVEITLRHLALHSSGLPRLPSRVRIGEPDPYGKYTDEALYHDLISTQLEAPPGSQIVYSNYGGGLLAFALGRKLGGGYGKALAERVLGPLALRDTFLEVPAAAAARRAAGSNDDLVAVPPWTWGALAGAGGLVSTARDQLTLLEAELDAAAGSKGTLRPPMRLTQEPQLAGSSDNVGIGWMIDQVGRYWHNGGTAGYRCFVGFDPKTRRGVVVLAATATTVVDQLARAAYEVLDGKPPPPLALPTAAQLASYAGNYQLADAKLVVSVVGKRLYLEGPGEPRHRLVPLSERQFWIEALQSVARFEDEAGAIARVVFVIGDRELAAPRTP